MAIVLRGSKLLDCRFDAAANTATVDASALGNLNAGTGLVMLTSFRAKDVSAGDWNVRLLLSAIADDGTGNRASTGATFQ